MKWTNSCDALVDFVEEHGGSMGGETRDHLFNIVQNIVDGQSVLETPALEAIRNLHRVEVIPMMAVDCANENCEHDDGDECFAAGTPIEVCRHCFYLWDDDKDREEPTPEFYPCETIRLLGAPVEPVPAPTSVIELIRDFIGNIEESERRWNADYIASGVLAICGSAPVPAPRLEWATDEHYWGGSKTAEYAWADVPQDLHWMADGHRLCLFDNEYDRAWCVSSVEGRTHDGTKALAESLAAVLSPPVDQPKENK